MSYLSDKSDADRAVDHDMCEATARINANTELDADQRFMAHLGAIFAIHAKHHGIDSLMEKFAKYAALKQGDTK